MRLCMRRSKEKKAKLGAKRDSAIELCEIRAGCFTKSGMLYLIDHNNFVVIRGRTGFRQGWLWYG